MGGNNNKVLKNPYNTSVFDIANYFLYKGDIEDGEKITNLKLQKLVYYAQGLHLVLFKKPIFNETIEAWTYGPVVPSLYKKYKDNGSDGISSEEKYDPKVIDTELRSFLDDIYSAFGQFSAIGLMNLSHTDECWIEAAEHNDTISHILMMKSMKKYVNG